MQAGLHPFTKGNLSKTIALLLFASTIVWLFYDVILAGLRILFGACLIAFLITPLARLFEQKLRRPTACLLALALTILLLLAAIAILLPVMIRQLSGIADLLPEAFSRIRAAVEGAVHWLQSRFPEFSLPEPSLSSLEQSFSGIAKHTLSYAGSIAGGIYQLALSVILAYFLMSGRDRALLRAELLVPSAWRRLAVWMGSSLSRELRLYLRGQFTIALCVAVLAGIALTVIGIKAAPLLGLIVGLFNVIPYFGPFIGGIPAVIMALSISWQKAAFTVLALFLVQQADGLVLSPRIMGSITGFSPAVVLLAIFLGQQAFGIWGMLLAMPLLMSVRTVYRVFVQRHENN